MWWRFFGPLLSFPRKQILACNSKVLDLSRVKGNLKSDVPSLHKQSITSDLEASSEEYLKEKGIFLRRRAFAGTGLKFWQGQVSRSSTLKLGHLHATILKIKEGDYLYYMNKNFMPYVAQFDVIERLEEKNDEWLYLVFHKVHKPLKSFLEKKKNECASWKEDSRDMLLFPQIAELIWKLSIVIEHLHTKKVVGVVRQQSIFLTSNGKGIKIIPISKAGDEVSPNLDWKELGIILQFIYDKCFSGEHEVKDLYSRLLSGDIQCKNDVQMHPAMWTVDMKYTFIQNLSVFLKEGNTSSEFNAMITLFETRTRHTVIQLPWDTKLDSNLLSHMQAYQGPIGKAYYDIKNRCDYIHLMCNVVAHPPHVVLGKGGSYRLRHFARAEPLLFANLTKVLVKMGAHYLFPSFN